MTHNVSTLEANRDDTLRSKSLVKTSFPFNVIYELQISELLDQKQDYPPDSPMDYFK